MCEFVRFANTPAAPKIDRALVDNEAYRSVAICFGFSESAVYRHKKHLAEHLAKAVKVTKNQQTAALVTRLQERETVSFTSARDLLTEVEAVGRSPGDPLAQ